MLTSQRLSKWRKAQFGGFSPFGVSPSYPAEINRDTKNYNYDRAVQLAPVSSVVRFIASQTAASDLLLEAKVEEDKWEIVDENLTSWLDVDKRPNTHQSQYDFLYNLACNLLVGGQVGVLILSRKNGRPDKLVSIPSRHLNITYRGNTIGREDYIPGYAHSGDIHYYLDDGEYVEPYTSLTPQGDLLHLKLMTRNSIIYGESPLMWAAPPLRTALAADAYTEFAITTPWPHGILTTKGRPTPEHIKSLQKQLNRVMNSPHKTHIPPITSGDLDFIQTYIKPEELQLLDTRKFAISQVCALYGVPEALIGSAIAKATGSGYRSLLNGYAKSTQIPFNNLIADALSEFIEGDYRVRLRPKHIMELDPLEESRVLTRLVSGGIITANEARKEIGKEPIEGGDELRVSTMPSDGDDGGDSDSGKDEDTADETETNEED